MRLNILYSIFIFGICLLGGAPSGFGQIFSVGVTGGVGLTDGIENQTIDGYHFYSYSKDYIVGPMVELNLPLHLSVEADALYRPLSLASYISLDNGVNTAVALPRDHLGVSAAAEVQVPVPRGETLCGTGPVFSRGWEHEWYIPFRLWRHAGRRRGGASAQAEGRTPTSLHSLGAGQYITIAYLACHQSEPGGTPGGAVLLKRGPS
jgi:hypothetical protein